jgi:AraC-like DNA-binding protein
VHFSDRTNTIGLGGALSFSGSPLLLNSHWARIARAANIMADSPRGHVHLLDPDDYQASFRGVKINLFFTHPGQFKARLSWVQLPHLVLVRANESRPRLAHVSLSPARTAIVFPTRLHPVQTWDGSILGSRSFVIHGPDGRLYQWTRGASNLGLIVLSTDYLVAQLKALGGSHFRLPPTGSVLQPSRFAAARLRQLHWRICQLAEDKPGIITREKVINALESDLLHALADCLTSNAPQDFRGTRRRHKDIINRFEDTLAAHSDRAHCTTEICAAIGVPERTLRVCCTEILGISAAKYMRLRRLNLAHSALNSCDHADTNVASIAQRYGFTELGRFAVEYRTIFGERPSVTLRRAQSQGR